MRPENIPPQEHALLVGMARRVETQLRLRLQTVVEPQPLGEDLYGLFVVSRHPAKPHRLLINDAATAPLNRAYLGVHAAAHVILGHSAEQAGILEPHVTDGQYTIPMDERKKGQQEEALWLTRELMQPHTPEYWEAYARKINERTGYARGTTTLDAILNWNHTVTNWQFMMVRDILQGHIRAQFPF